MSYEEYVAFEHTRSLVEWVNGEAIIHMAPIDIHQDLAGFLFRLLAAYVEFFALGVVRIAPFEMHHLPGYASREPDILFVRHDHPERLTRQRIEGPADLVMEVISPDSVTRDTRDKFQEYAAAGVEEYWIFDPRPRQQTVRLMHRDATGRYQGVPADGAGSHHSIVVPGFWLRPAWLWQQPLPDAHRVLQEMAPQILRDEAALREAEARGVQQGRIEGVQQGRIETVLRQLTRRCGALDAALTEQVRHLPTPQLDALTEALLDFSSSDDLRTWLQSAA
jgi:Uma2 family endonuclease